ncbi:hypothetical protein AWB71_06006 [Caballeronia peredens]|nr:hypothetical protein AWB71_06006 [Caballeronia peredens]
MSDQRFYEIEATLAALTAGVKDLNAQGSPETLLDHIPDDKAGELNRLLVGLFSDLPPQNIAITPDVQLPQGMKDFGMRIGRTTKPGETLPAKMRFFRVSPSWQSLSINLIGLGLAIALVSPTAVVPALNIVKTCFDGLVTLERDNDADAMTCFEAVIRWRVENAQEDATLWPTLPEIIAQFDSLPNNNILDREKTLTALKRLEKLGIVTVAKWAATAGDMDQENNQWKTVF